MHRARNPSPSPFFDKLLHRHTENSPLAKHFKPFNRFASAIGADTLSRHEAGNRPAVLGDRELFAASNTLKKRRKLRFA
jgi:hypothetical protein